MTTVIVREFTFSQDFRSVLWRPTIVYNLLRACSAGVVLGLLMLLFPRSPADRLLALTAPVLWPLGYAFFFLPMGLLLSFFARSVPFVGLLATFMAFVGVTMGDPGVCVLKHVAPHLVPVESPPLFSLNLLWLVLDAPEIVIA